MKAVIRERFDTRDALRVADIEPPALDSEDTVIINVKAASVNPADWYAMAGQPLIARPTMGLFRPSSPRIGTDFAGEVDEVGTSAKEFSPGDRVFGMRTGALAEKVAITQDKLAPMPRGSTFEEAAAIPIAGVTALQALRDHGRLIQGQHVLVNGASGGVGTFTVQIAKALGAKVTAVCRTRNLEMVSDLGADHVIDYTTQDFTDGPAVYDLMIDNVSSQPYRRYRRVLKPDARVVIVGGLKKPFLGPLGKVLGAVVSSAGKSQKAMFFIAKNSKPDLIAIKQMVESGKVRPVVEKVYDLGETAAAFDHLGDGHARGKIVVKIDA